jgi:hypothetical protein
LISEKDIKVGDMVEILEITDTWSSLKKGSKGVITKVEEDQELFWVNWENGEKLALLIGIDKYRIIKK